MSIRLRILVLILMIAFIIMEVVVSPDLNGGRLVVSGLFCAAMVGIVCWHATKQKDEAISGGVLFLHSAVASIACSVALIITVQIPMIFFGLDFFDVVSVYFLKPINKENWYQIYIVPMY